jgi:hypothetical protein
MNDRPRTIGTVEELREQVPAILKRLNADQGLLQAALANPLAALEELGYVIPPSLHRELDRRIRFTAAERERLDTLTRRLHKLAGVEFDPDQPDALERLLFTRLELPEPPPAPVRVAIPRPNQDTPYQRTAGATQAADPAIPAMARPRLEVRYHAAASGPQPDVLAYLEGRHPIVEPLLEYRAIMARHAPFAPRELYERIRRGSVAGPALKLRARLHRKER